MTPFARRSIRLPRARSLLLLLVHGTGDDNVHFQNSVQLIHELQTQRKQFDLMIYPNKTHSISGADSRVHLYTLMTGFLKDRLMGARPTS